MASWIYERQSNAAIRVKAVLAKPLPDYREMCGADTTCDPWEIFPAIYGTYSSDFGEAALTVLRNLQLAQERRYDEQTEEELPHHIFREMLCTADLCDYGTSPRGCFPTEDFGILLPELIKKWAAFETILWGDG